MISQKFSSKIIVNNEQSDKIDTKTLLISGNKYLSYGNGMNFSNIKLYGVENQTFTLTIMLSQIYTYSPSEKEFKEGKNVTLELNFGPCAVGQIHSKFCPSCSLDVCAFCSLGTYSLGNSSICQKCNYQTSVKCFGSSIYLH